MNLRILLIEDSSDDALLVERALRRAGHELVLHRVQTSEEMDAALHEEWDCVICDYSLPRFNAPAALALLRRRGLDVPFIIVSGTVGEEAAVEAMRAGAQDYVMKSSIARLPLAVEREVKEAGVRRHRQALEDQLLQARKMEAIGQLAGGVAHDFNNLLTVMLSFSRFVYEDLGPDHASREDLREVIECAERASSVTRQLLAFSRRQASEPQALDLNAVLGRLSPMLRRLLGEDVQLQVVPGAELWQVEAAPGDLEQVLLNLAANAREAMPKGGSLRLATSNVAPGEGEAQRPGLAPSPTGHVRLEVTDSGVGMSPEVQQRAFEPFFTTKAQSVGTGLGLATVYGLVKQYDGQVFVRSTEGAGTTFEIYLPRATARPERLEPMAVLPLKRTDEATVLLVEDDGHVRSAAARALTRAGIKVVEAASPDEALLLTEQLARPPDLLLLDVVLPGTDGHELAVRLRGAHPGLRVLFMSGHGVGSSGAYLQKPFTPDALVRKVQGVLTARTPEPRFT